MSDLDASHVDTPAEKALLATILTDKVVDSEDVGAPCDFEALVCYLHANARASIRTRMPF